MIFFAYRKYSIFMYIYGVFSIVKLQNIHYPREFRGFSLHWFFAKQLYTYFHENQDMLIILEGDYSKLIAEKIITKKYNKILMKT